MKNYLDVVLRQAQKGTGQAKVLIKSYFQFYDR